jgi:flagellar biosynthesis activator protein FlaF
MQHAAQAYGRVAKQTSSPRDLESNLLLSAASRLQAIHDDWDAKHGELRDALLYNRKLWTIFLAAVTKDDHPLPASIRQNVANLGIFVMNHTVLLTQEPARERLPVLVTINRELAAGLQGRGG